MGEMGFEVKKVKAKNGYTLSLAHTLQKTVTAQSKRLICSVSTIFGRNLHK
jgi:hypothetical protein